MTEGQVVVIVVMIEEVAVVQEVVEIEEAVVVQEVAADKVEGVADLVVVEEAAVLEELVAAVAEEDNGAIKILNKKLVTRNFIKCYNRKDRNTGKCRRAV
jgi:hypothetical protein